MRKLLLSISLLMPFALLAQNRHIDSLKTLLTITRSGTVQADLYYDIAISLQRIDPPASKIYIDSVAAIAKRLNYPMGKANVYAFDAVRCSLQGKFDSLLICSQHCMAVADKYKIPLAAAKAYNGMGIYHWQTGDYKEAIKNHLAALRIYEQQNDSAGISSSKANLAWVCFDNQEITGAEKYALEALNMAKAINKPTIIVNALQVLANIYGSTGQYQKALDIDDETIRICKRENNKRGLSQAYSNIANCYTEMQLYDRALQYQQQVLDIDLFFNDKKQVSDTYLNIAQIYVKKKAYRKALKLTKQGIAYAEESKFKQGQKAAWRLLSTIYEANGDYKSAINAHHKYEEISLALVNEHSISQIAQMEARYHTEKKEQTIKLLNAENQLQRLSINNQKITICFIIGLLIVALVMACLLYNRNKLKQRGMLQAQLLKHQDLLTKAVLAAEDHERERIAADLHDGVGQLFSAVKMNLSGLFDRVDFRRREDSFLAESTLALVDESCKEVRAISHQMMPNALLRSGLVSDLRSFIEKIDADKLKISLETRGFKERMESNTETMLYRILQETINNVIKHAHATRLNIKLKRDKEGINAEIMDNGVGFDMSQQGEGIGLKNIFTRIAYLKGTVNYHTAPGKGTHVLIVVPV